jgi:hypothetical protein
MRKRENHGAIGLLPSSTGSSPEAVGNVAGKRRMTPDAFTPHEVGLTRLLEELDKDHQCYANASLLAAEFHENIRKARLLTDSDNLRGERYRILEQLNRLALEDLGISFSDLCKEDSSQPPAGDTARIGSRRFVAEVVVAIVVVLAIAVGLCSTVGWPMVEQWAAVWLLAPPAPQTIPEGPEITVRAGGTTAIHASAKGADRYEWTLMGEEQISSFEGSSILYTAPNKPGVVKLSIAAHNDQGDSPLTELTINIVCVRETNAAGTVSPAVAISSITFVVNGVKQVVNNSGALSASSGDHVQVKEVTICVSPFAAKEGQFYVSFDPVNTVRGIIESEAKSTSTVAVATGFETISGPAHTWTIGDNWRHISVVTVHYPACGSTQDPNCENGACEIDDRIIVNW